VRAVLSDRRRLVLQALVEEYIASGQPVGSKSLVDHHDLGCSSATVRSELAALEETGYLYQPHVSAGRVPTDLGYREFVDEILQEVDSLPALEAEESARRYAELAGEIDELIRNTSAMLAHLTHYVALVVAPTVSLSKVRKVDLVHLGGRRALVVVITEDGQVVNRGIELPPDVAEERLAEVERALVSLAGKKASEVRPLKEVLDHQSEGDGLVGCIIDELLDCLEEADRDRLYHVGVPELLALPEFSNTEQVRPLVALLEDGLSMLDTLSDVMRARNDLTVRIGHENRLRELGGMSLVATRYRSGSSDGVVGVIGPTRMDYPRTIAAVRHAAEGLTDALK
jgi:heat-inducible transcriptional repressor